jgi:DNA-binding transcriptional MerR regulator
MGTCDKCGAEIEDTVRANDIRKITGMTYRKINDWETKGIIPKTRKENERWRRFGFMETMTIAICCELRQKFGIEINQLKAVSKSVLKRPSNNMRLMSFFVTDLKYNYKLFIETVPHIEKGGYVVLYLPPIYKKVSVYFPNHERGSHDCTGH